MSNKSIVIHGVYVLFPVLLVFIVLAGLPNTGHSLSVTMTEVEDCLVNEAGFNCDRKEVVTFPVPSRQRVTLEGVAVTTIQKDGEPTALEETIEFEIEKSPTEVLYPLHLLHTVPYFPYEEEVCAGSTACDASAESASPTCGWTYQGSYPVEDSQGFCSSPAKAHCMRDGDLYYHGYEIGRPSTFFDVGFTVKKGDEKLEFALTPAEMHFAIDQANGFKMKAELVGDVEGYTEPLDLSNYILYVPSSPDTHPYVQDYVHNMLLVPREEVSLDGTECDKVGTSFHTFRSQEAHRNTRDIGDCLHNQLFHKHNSDLQKLIMNPDAETSYLLQGKKVFKGSMEFKSGMAKTLVHKPIGSAEQSMVAMTIDIDTLKVVNTESLGIIVDAWVKSFTALSREGDMTVQIQNWGDLKTEYVVTVTNCNMNINHAIPQQSVVLSTWEEAEFHFDINTMYNLDTSNECLVSLMSPTGRVYDEVIVKFDTFKHHSAYSWDQLLKGNYPPPLVCADPCVDDDGDGVCENTGADNCTGSIAGAAVDEAGCSIAQLCPCDANWKNHGKYVACISSTAESFMGAGLITEAARDEITSAAGRSECGTP